MANGLKPTGYYFLTILAMVGFGLVMVYSASSVVAELNFSDGAGRISSRRQIGWAVVSFLVLMYFKRRDYRMLEHAGVGLFGLGIVLIAADAVYFVDPRTHRWFRIGRLGSLQPSEFAKPALILFLAYFITALEDDQ